MDIADRIKFFLNSKQISNSQFADTCKIPRPTVSQILNGRNKKVSDEIISKIHIAYPSLSVLWLMFGEGEMMPADAIDTSTTFNTSVGEQAHLPFDNDGFGDDVLSRQTAPRIQFSQTNARPIENIALSGANPRQSITLEPASHTAPLLDKRKTAGGARVIRITVYYSDNSFQEFIPRD